jgi:hypothetical protein
MASAVRPLGSLSMARGIDAGPDTAKIGSADRVQVHHARLLAVIGVRKTFPHGLDPNRTLAQPNFRLVGRSPHTGGHSDHSGNPALRSIDSISAAHSGLRAFI